MRFDQIFVQALLQKLFTVVRQPRVQELDVGRAQLIDVQAQRRRVARDDRAVEVVARAFVLLTLPFAAREPDEVGVLFQQVHDMAVRKLRRVAHAFGRHGLDARLVGFLRGRVGQEHTPAKLREEGEPERVVFVHVERARNADRTALRLFFGKRRVAEQALGLVLEQVRNVGLLNALAEAFALFAAVAGNEAAMFAGGLVDTEIVHGEQAAVRAAPCNGPCGAWAQALRFPRGTATSRKRGARRHPGQPRQHAARRAGPLRTGRVQAGPTRRRPCCPQCPDGPRSHPPAARTSAARRRSRRYRPAR